MSMVPPLGCGPATGLSPRSLFITNDFPPRIGGAQSYYWGVIRTLDPSSVTIVAPGHPDAETFDATHPYRVIRTDTAVLWPTPALLRQTSALAAEVRADLIQLGHPLPAGLLGPQLKEHCGLPYIVFLGGSEVTIPAAIPGLNRLLRHVLGNASMLLTVSEYTARAAHQQVRGKVRAEVLRPPLNVGEFAPVTPDEATALRRQLGIDGDSGDLSRSARTAQGPGELIDALALLRHEFPKLHLALIGEGRTATRLYDRAQRRKVGGRVHLTGALVDSAVTRVAASGRHLRVAGAARAGAASRSRGSGSCSRKRRSRGSR